MPPAKILLVESDPDAKSFFIHALQQAGYEATWVADGLIALNELERVHPDVVLVDLVGSEDGAALAKQIASKSNVPIIAITSLTPLDGPEHELNDIPSVKRLVFKPCRARTFLEAVADVLDCA